MLEDISIERWGVGEPVVLVHGAMMGGEACWRKQRPLSERWLLVVLSRRGYVPNPPAPLSDYELDASDVAATLGDGAHLVGHSYGGLVAMLAAARRPDAVRSLCLLEPASQAFLRGDPEVEAGIQRHETRRQTKRDPREFLIDFMESVDAAAYVPDPLPAEMEQHARLLMTERAPYEAQIPDEILSAAHFPKLVVSGGHSDTQERVCDITAIAVGAMRCVVSGAAHLIPRAPRCNTVLERFWRNGDCESDTSAERGRPFEP